MEKNLRVAVGSLNPVKHEAVRAVLEPLLETLTITGVNVPSGVADQPWGDAETRKGALNRARAACQAGAADLGIGLEGGLIDTELGLMTCAWCAVVAADGRVGMGGGAHMMLPPQARRLLDEGLELGAVMDSLTGLHNTKHADGAIGILTAGLETRETAYAHILRLALAPFRSAAYFMEPLS
ncbi:MAG: inosine/xanthosine triphosphatase [Anaerolineae bacterium]|nr:inosine/xanthosine triphosphatase [Anaerolineae bacterium]